MSWSDTQSKSWSDVQDGVSVMNWWSYHLSELNMIFTLGPKYQTVDLNPKPPGKPLFSQFKNMQDQDGQVFATNIRMMVVLDVTESRC